MAYLIETSAKRSSGKERGKTVLAVIAVAAVLTACATPSSPPPAAQNQPGAFSEVRLDADRYRVMLVGQRQEAPETVQRELLKRAAELAVREGYDWFEATEQGVRVQSELVASPSPYMQPGFMWGGGEGFLPKSWRDTGPRWGGGWRDWDPFQGEPTFANRARVKATDLVIAAAVIVFHKGVKPGDLARAYDARTLLAPVRPLEPTRP
ncbi:hypothetical protein B7G68_07805 [Caulobacter segnis]|uniref:Uncharacterized protein n=2 Tax=Caulobacter segnis TaxID=88688 RepID=D5VG04_CAUST|nr:hypothetical protein [Caulobacter segnis]ADG10007.1 conserved hypothetical protein [Caulobacter segnis ATCC 21756]AVQ01763.1 hypothetical protein B7G68_07805 [Caulobacter segnis]